MKKQVINAALTDTWAQRFVREVQIATLGVMVDPKVKVRVVP